MKSHVRDELLQSSSDESHSEDDEEAWKLTDEVEKEFFKTLSHIKSKDPKIYQKDVEFFKDVPIPEQKPKEKPKCAPLTLRDYEWRIVAEKGGELSDEELPAKSMTELSYVEEQKALKNSLKNLLQSDSEYESEAEWGGLFKKRKKTNTEKEKEDEDYKEWLKGQKSEAPDEEVAKEMKPLRDFWTNPALNQEDEFLRDYILNKRFLQDEDKDESRVHIDKIQDGSETEENEDKLSKVLSHRFEEPDQEFIKRYPRVMEHSVRRKDDSRRRKRVEVKERKQKEKVKKKLEIRQKQKLKKKEIEEKLEELKQLTGNQKLAFENVLEKDFDIDEHDKAMQRLFNEEFYSQNDPTFNPNDGLKCKDNWNYEGEEDIKEEADDFVDNEEPQCEDPDFNMDCDYDPTAAENMKKKTSRSGRRKDKHRRTTVSEAVKHEKPVFDPTTHRSYQEYLDQYYAIDCEDFIGELPCRFKYRHTVPNSYGLTIEEILAADPKELERWCSIRRVTQLKPSFKEKGDAMSFKRRAANEELKRKILPSLFKTTEVKSEPLEDDANENHEIKIESDETSVKTKKNKSIKSNNDDNGKTDLIKKRKLVASESIIAPNKRRKISPEQKKSPITYKNNERVNINKKKTNQEDSKRKPSLLDMSDARLQAYGIKPKKFRNKLKYNSVGSNVNKSINKSNRNQSIKRKRVNLSRNIKNERQTKINKKKETNKSELSKKNANGWVISNAS